MKLYQLAKLIRSKNAGPFMLTIDILFETDEVFNEVINSGVLTKECIGSTFGVDPQIVDYYELPLAKAIKFSFPRPHVSGDIDDDDVYGAQFHGPLVTLEIPVSENIKPRIE